MDLLTVQPKKWNRGRRLLLVGVAVFGIGCQALLTDAAVVDVDGDALCAEYCGTVSETCEAENLQYGSSQQCADMCRTFDLGDADAESGNTLSCRLHFALEAFEDPDIHCRAAGPGGNGVCGGDCESFCRIQDEICTAEDRQYNTITECTSACALFDDSVQYNADNLSGDSFACRLTHLTLAASSPKVHCPHILPESAVCL